MSTERQRVTADDLRIAALWLRAYEDHQDDVGSPDSPGARCARVAAWLDAEASRRQSAQHARAVTRIAAAELGITVTEANRRMGGAR